MYLNYLISHYLLPGHSNNHKAKILHSSSLFYLGIFLILYQILLQFFPLFGVRILGYAANIPPATIIELTNQKRAEAGISGLTYSPTLAEAARQKGEHMLANDYWAHVAPDGTEPWKFFSDVGYKYRYAGENLARDFSNSNSAIDAWLASPSHRENMLSSKYKEIGVAVVEGDLNGVDTTIIVQLFGTRLVDTTPQVPIAEAKPQATAAPIATITPLPTITTIVTPSPVIAPPVALVTPLPTLMPTPEVAIAAGPSQPNTQASRFDLLVSPFETTRGVSIATTFVLLLVMVVDGIIVGRRRLVRVSGRTFAHFAFLGMILAILIIAKAGQIL